MDKNNKEKNSKRKQNKKRLIAAICAVAVAFVFLMSCLYPAFRSSAADVSSAKAARDKAKKELQAIKDEKADLVKEFAAFDRRLTEVEDQIAALNESIEGTKREIAQKEAELAEAEAKAEAYKEEFKTRARIMYENGSTSYLEVLFGAADFSDLMNKIEIVGSIINYDRDVLDRFVENRNIIKNAKAEKENLLVRQEDEQAGLGYRQEELEIMLEKQQAMIEKLSANETVAAKALAEAEKKYEEEERKAQEEIRRKMAASNVAVKYTGGKFAWPVPSSSRITSPYGYRIHPISKTNKLHRGIDISAAYGASVVAAEAGTVIVAGYNSSYGRYVVINHGGGYTTLYAHNSALLVSAGQQVSRGQQIAKAGSTGNSTGPHCHFEVSCNGNLQNPLNFLQ